MKRSKESREILLEYLPENTVDQVLKWIRVYEFTLKINKSRASKLGDYRSPFKNQGHRITINHDLNPYSFFITLVHELAHLVCWERHRDRVSPHGKEWKKAYKELMKPFLTREYFPRDILLALTRYMEDPAAASCTDEHLYRILRQYNKEPVYFVEQFPENAVFRLKNGMVFKKGELLRKRYKCLELKTRRVYFVSPLAEAIHVEGREKGQLRLFNAM